MLVKTSELTDTALDWAVAKTDKRNIEWDGIAHWVNDSKGCAPIGPKWKQGGKPCGYSPTTNWSHGGPIIERGHICIDCIDSEHWSAVSEKRGWLYGPTPLIAAMRCYVASKLGDEVDIPDELVNG